MKFNQVSFSVAHSIRVAMCGICIFSLTGCDQQVEKPLEDKKAHPSNNGIAVSNANVEPSSKKLTEVAGRANFPADEQNHAVHLPDYALDFVGRYYTKVKCNDGFAPCSEGTAEFVLTLLADGTVYRSIVQHGKIFTFKNEIKDEKSIYRKDRWQVNPERTELVVYRKEGIDIYYDIKDNTQMVMNIEKTKRLNSKQGVLQLPNISYVLKKDIETE